MDFNQIRYFLTLAETLNFTRAAELCHVTQPTLTQAIKKLEDELGGPLIHRDGKYSRLTTLGRTLRMHFESIEASRRALKESAHSVTSGDVDELNIGLMCTIGPRALARFLDRFQTQNPNAVVYLHDVTPDAIPELLLSGGLDGAFAARHSEKHKRLDYVHLYGEAMVVAFPDGHPFGEKTVVPLATVACQRYLDRLHCEFREAFGAFAQERQIQLDVAFSSQREDWIQDMIRSGVGVSVVPEFSLIAPVLDHRPIVDPPLNRHVEFVTVYGGPKSAALRALIRMASQHCWIEAADRAAGEDPAKADASL